MGWIGSLGAGAGVGEPGTHGDGRHGQSGTAGGAGVAGVDEAGNWLHIVRYGLDLYGTCFSTSIAPSPSGVRFNGPAVCCVLCVLENFLVECDGMEMASKAVVVLLPGSRPRSSFDLGRISLLSCSCYSCGWLLTARLRRPRSALPYDHGLPLQ